MQDDWFEIEQRLTEALVRGFDEQHCHVWAEGEAYHYVQFAFGPGEVYAEAVANAFLEPGERLDPQGERKLRALGWLPPVRSLVNTRGQPTYPNWYRHWRASRPPFAEIVEVTMRTLRDVHWIQARDVRVTRQHCSWCEQSAVG